MLWADSVQVPARVEEIGALCAWLAIFVAIFVPLERLFGLRPQKILRRGFLVDLCYFFVSSLIPAFLISVPMGVVAWAAHQVVPVGVLTFFAALPFGARLVLAFVMGEVGSYWGHRWSHEIPFLWDFHAIHHSSEEMDFLVNTRAHPVDMAFTRFCALVPMYVLGLAGPAQESGSLVPLVATMIATAWGFFIHANLRWRFGPLEWLVSTPAFHHWHHTKSGPINRNYASNLPWLDRLFGTHFLPRDQWPAEYGIMGEMPNSLVGQLAYPFVPRPPALPEAAPIAVVAEGAGAGSGES